MELKSTVRILVEKHLKELSPAVLEAARIKPKLADFGTPLTAKIWVLPNAKIVALNQWHWSWLKNNLDVARQFTIEAQVKRIAGSDEAKGRIVALKAGFIRINYERNNGRLVIEGCRKSWTRHVKDAVFMLVVENSKDIDHMAVTLFNDTCTQIVAQAETSLFRFSGQDKLNHLPLISESARGKALAIAYQRASPQLDCGRVISAF